LTVPRHGNALILHRKFFLRIAKNRLGDPSEIRAPEFEGEFRRSAISSVSATIGLNWSIFAIFCESSVTSLAKKDRQQ